jgi:hypothetical protein
LSIIHREAHYMVDSFDSGIQWNFYIDI